MLEKIAVFLKKVRNKLINIATAVRLETLRIRCGLRIMSSEESLNHILKYQCSVARFGDGELNMILKGKSIGFQAANQVLATRLEETLYTNKPNLLICLPHTLRKFDGETILPKEFWKTFVFDQLQTITGMLRRRGMGNYRFGDTQMTRPYMDYLDQTRAGKLYSQMKQLWDKKRILIVEGAATRMGVGNDLFSNAASVQRILCPSKNAFESYDEIVNVVSQLFDHDLVLIALGPAATVLAADLSQRGIWAVDVGHLDVEYEWYLAKATRKTAIKDKAVNEVERGYVETEFENEAYRGQVIARVNG